MENTWLKNSLKTFILLFNCLRENLQKELNKNIAP